MAERTVWLQVKKYINFHSKLKYKVSDFVLGMPFKAIVAGPALAVLSQFCPIKNPNLDKIQTSQPINI
jgi:hypothetical protein